MSGLLLLVGSMVIFFVAYVTYGSWLCKKWVTAYEKNYQSAIGINFISFHFFVAENRKSP